MPKNGIGLLVMIVAIIIALIISARGAIFSGEPIGDTSFYPMLGVCGVALVVYFIMLKDDGKRNKK